LFSPQDESYGFKIWINIRKLSKNIDVEISHKEDPARSFRHSCQEVIGI